MPFLEESEWKQISPLLREGIEDIKEYREKNDCDLQTAKKYCTPEVMLKFEELTGKSGVHSEIIYHHRLKDWGQECPECSYLLRTEKAKYCANCSWVA